MDEERLLHITRQPYEHCMVARVVGTLGASIRGEAVEGSYGDLVVILERGEGEGQPFERECFNLAGLVALARMGAERTTATRKEPTT